jgi:hypothetical protein
MTEGSVRRNNYMAQKYEVAVIFVRPATLSSSLPTLMVLERKAAATTRGFNSGT